MGVFIFAETFGTLVKHSSGKPLLKFHPRHKHWGEILFKQKCGFLSKHPNIVVKFFLKYFPAKISSPTEQWGESFILTTREVLFQITLKNIETKNIRFLFCSRTNVVWIRIFQLNQNEWWITDMSENKTYTSWLRAPGRKSFVLKILRE